MVPASPLLSGVFMSSIGLYLHIPFCDGKCGYCNFFSRRASEELISEYTRRLIEGIQTWGDSVRRSVDTVYFGGGTPSLLGHDRLIAILNAVYGSFAVTADAEITVEVNPSSAEDLDFSVMRRAGFNRLSIGMQSADNRELCLLSRRHSAEDAAHTVQRAQKAGFDNLSLDVMLAIPGQTTASLNRTLAFCAACGVRHISAYILKVEEGTRFYAERESLGLLSDDDQAALYEFAVERLAALGYPQYEISNFAHKGYESRHNLHYWHDEAYLGIGPSAHSFLDGRRFYYENDFQRFYDNQTVFESLGGDSEEYIMLALRLKEGLVFERYAKRFGKRISDRFLKAAAILQRNGLCIVDNRSVSLTVKGCLVSNAVIAYLLENT